LKQRILGWLYGGIGLRVNNKVVQSSENLQFDINEGGDLSCKLNDNFMTCDIPLDLYWNIWKGIYLGSGVSLSVPVRYSDRTQFTTSTIDSVRNTMNLELAFVHELYTPIRLTDNGSDLVH
jgi:hypothetical protein